MKKKPELLIVDDDEAIRTQMKWALAGDYQIVIAGNRAEALAAFVDRRRELGSVELTADVDPRNNPSIKLLERAGFVESGRANGTWQVGDELCDSVYFRLEL